MGVFFLFSTLFQPKSRGLVMSLMSSSRDAMVRSLSYVLSYAISAALIWNLGKARKCWAVISCVLAHEGASPKISAMFYKATIQTVLLYGAETWVVTSDIVLQVLRSFHHSMVRKLTGRYPQQLPDSEDWI
jgi:hypothetical protein